MESMSRLHGCDHPANKLLPWYANGSLDVEETASVKNHAASCRTCRREIEILLEVGRAVGEGDLPVLATHESPPARGRAGLRLGLGAAAAVVLAISATLLFWWVPRGSEPVAVGTPVVPTQAQPGPATPALRATQVLDLKGGPIRADGTSPSFAINRQTELVAIVFLAPVNSDVSRRVELRGPMGAVIARLEEDLRLDELARATLTVPADLIRAAGNYEVVLQEESVGAAPRAYRFPFKIEPPPDTSKD
ncbi:MAG TPA: zf-HC2 domain-containing protein [Candidatus Polarisedimenticolia bacterium]|nr:zf-HC2 domain-containing protein [Candidatus Polarisedimenticolia bacterium]